MTTWTLVKVFYDAILEPGTSDDYKINYFLKCWVYTLNQYVI